MLQAPAQGEIGECRLLLEWFESSESHYLCGICQTQITRESLVRILDQSTDVRVRLNSRGDIRRNLEGRSSQFQHREEAVHQFNESSHETKEAVVARGADRCVRIHRSRIQLNPQD